MNRYLLIGGLILVLGLILGANSHMLYVAVSSQPDCAEESVTVTADGDLQVLHAAKDSC